MSEDGATEVPDDVEVTVSIGDGQTVIEVTGERNLAVVVRSAGGEQIYLPPEDFAESPDRGTPYESPYRGGERAETPYGPAEAPETPYQSADGRSETPYQSADSRGETPYDGLASPATTGIGSTPTGLRIVHPEPISDLRFLR